MSAAPDTSLLAKRACHVLVVVPCLNEAANLAMLVKVLRKDRNAHLHHIVLVDGGSTDGSQAIIAQWVAEAELEQGTLSSINNPQVIQSAAVNLAVEQFGAGCEFLVRVDAHARYPLDYVSDLVDLALAQSPAPASLVVPMHSVARSTNWFAKACACAQNSLIGTGGAAHRLLDRAGPAALREVDHGHHALFRMDDFRALGGYDETFTHNEDAEYDTRLRAKGGTILLAGRLCIDYYPRATARALMRQYYQFGRGRARHWLKHRNPLRLRQMAPILVAPALILALLGSFVWALFAAPAALWALANLALAIVEDPPANGDPGRRLWRVERLAFIPAMLMQAAWSFGFWALCLRALTRMRDPTHARLQNRVDAVKLTR